MKKNVSMEEAQQLFTVGCACGRTKDIPGGSGGKRVEPGCVCASGLASFLIVRP